MAEIFIVGPLPFADKSSSGVSKYVHVLANALADSGHRVVVVAQKGASHARSARFEQANVWEPGYGCFTSIYRFLNENGARRISVQHEMFMYSYKLRVNALFLMFLLVCRLRGIRAAATMHHALPNAEVKRILVEGAYTRKELIPILLLGYRFFNFCAKLFASEVIEPHGIGALGPVGPERARVTSVQPVVPGSVVDASEIERVRRTFALPENYVLQFGFVSKYKGIEHVIAAARTLSGQIPFVAVAGLNVRQAREAEYVRYYERLRVSAEEAGILWLDYIPERDVEPVFKGARALLLPYTTFHGYSGLLSTAASLGVPALVSRAMAIPEFSGVAMEPNCAGVSSAIERFLSDPSYAAAVARATRRYGDSHSAAGVARGYAKALSL